VNNLGIYNNGDKSIQVNEILNFIFNDADDLVMILNKNYEYEWLNEDSHKKTLGYAKTDLLGMDATKLIHPDDIEYVFEQLANFFEKKEGRTQARVKHKDGHYVWIDIRGHIFQSKSGIDRLIMIGRDFTELKTTEQKLRDSEEKYRLIMENAMDFIIVLNDRFKIEYFNEPAVLKVLGYEYTDVIGKNILKFLHPDNYESAIESMTSNLALQHRQEFQIRKNDGDYIWGEIRGSSFLNVKGEKKYYLFIRDISDHKKAEQQLKESEEKYRGIVDNSYDGYFETNLRGDFIFVNKQICDLLGYSEKEYLGANFRKFIRTEDFDRLFAEFNSLYNDERSQIIYQYEALTKDGKTLLLEAAAYLKYDSDGNKIGFYALTRDLSIRKKLKESEENYRKAYEHAEFYKDLFTHDINNILQTILSTTELGVLTLPADSTVEDFKTILTDIKKQVLRGASLVSNVRILSKMESMQLLLKDTEVYNVLKTAIDNVSNSYQQEINIKLDFPNEKIRVMANELLLEAFENVLINAVKHNDNKVKELSINISEEKKDNIQYAKMEFIDNGQGVEDIRKKSIFERGYKSDKNVSGMG
jgi:PAS domain S-box-containing protein